MDEKKISENDLEGMSRGEFLKAMGAGIFVAGLYSMDGIMAFADSPEKGKTKLIAKAG